MSEWLETDLQIKAHTLVHRPENPKATLLYFHGYAEHPEKVLPKLLKAGFEKYLLLLPMGHHHFYSRRDEIVASWMTRFKREEQISQFLCHMNALLSGLHGNELELPFFSMGFSQGAAASYRFSALAQKQPLANFCLAGLLPAEAGPEKLAGRAVVHHLYCGSQDKIVAPSRVMQECEKLEEAGVNASFHATGSRHELSDQILEDVLHRIREIIS